MIKPRFAGLDAIDLEACSHGDATRYFKNNTLHPQGKTRRQTKIETKKTRAGAIAGCKMVTCFTADHIDAMGRLIVPEKTRMNLVQR